MDDSKVDTLTFGELEAFAGFGLTWFLTLYGTRVASHEAFSTKSGLVFSINLYESTRNGETECLSLPLITATVDMSIDIVFVGKKEASLLPFLRRRLPTLPLSQYHRRDKV